MQKVLKLFHLIALLVVFAASACAPPVKIQSPADAIMMAKYSLVGVNNTITALNDARAISLADAKRFAAEADKAAGHLKTAELFERQALPQDALGALTLANEVLLALQRSLNEKEKPK